jgi:hypothetical protein
MTTLWKAVIIGAIIFVIYWLIYKGIGNSMDKDEKIEYMLLNRLPTRVIVGGLIWWTMLITEVILFIVAIVKS